MTARRPTKSWRSFQTSTIASRTTSLRATGKSNAQVEGIRDKGRQQEQEIIENPNTRLRLLLLLRPHRLRQRTSKTGGGSQFTMASFLTQLSRRKPSR